MAKKISLICVITRGKYGEKLENFASPAKSCGLGELGGKDHMSPSISREKFREASKKLTRKRKNLSGGNGAAFHQLGKGFVWMFQIDETP